MNGLVTHEDVLWSIGVDRRGGGGCGLAHLMQQAILYPRPTKREGR